MRVSERRLLPGRHASARCRPGVAPRAAVLEPGTAWYEQLMTQQPGLWLLRARPAGVEAHLLEGVAGTAADRAAAVSLTAAEPRMRWWIAAHREFQRLACDYAWNVLGLRQILDLGCGYATATGSVYRAVVDWEHRNPGQTLRYVGVDADPIAASMLNSDIRRPPRHIGHRADIGAVDDLLRLVGGPLDFGEPVLIIAARVLQHLTAPGQTLTQLGAHVAAGSVLAVSHPAMPHPPGHPLRRAMNDYRATVAPWYSRTADTAVGILRAWTVPPGGVVPVGRWRPPARIGAVGLLPDIADAPGWAALACAGPALGQAAGPWCGAAPGGPR